MTSVYESFLHLRTQWLDEFLDQAKVLAYMVFLGQFRF